jgi:hypothetical protein
MMVAQLIGCGMENEAISAAEAIPVVHLGGFSVVEYRGLSHACGGRWGTIAALWL